MVPQVSQAQPERRVPKVILARKAHKACKVLKVHKVHKAL